MSLKTKSIYLKKKFQKYLLVLIAWYLILDLIYLTTSEKLVLFCVEWLLKKFIRLYLTFQKAVTGDESKRSLLCYPVFWLLLCFIHNYFLLNVKIPLNQTRYKSKDCCFVVAVCQVKLPSIAWDIHFSVVPSTRPCLLFNISLRLPSISTHISQLQVV